MMMLAMVGCQLGSGLLERGLPSQTILRMQDSPQDRDFVL